MSVAIAWLFRWLGWPGCLLLAFYVYEEGIPGAHRIPFLSSIPVIGDLTTGRVHAYAAQQVKLATAGLVEKTEKDALAAQLAEERRRAAAASQALEEHRKRLMASQAAEKEASERLEAEIAENERLLEKSGRACRFDQRDVDFILRPQRRTPE